MQQQTQTQSQSQPTKFYKLPHNVNEALLKYFQEQPYKVSAQIIAVLSQLEEITDDKAIGDSISIDGVQG